MTRIPKKARKNANEKLEKEFNLMMLVSNYGVRNNLLV
jgi:hypothetical protein